MTWRTRPNPGTLLAALVVMAVIWGVSLRFGLLMETTRTVAARFVAKDVHRTLAQTHARLLLAASGRPTASAVAAAAFGVDAGMSTVHVGHAIVEMRLDEQQIHFRVVSLQGNSNLDAQEGIWTLPVGTP